MDEIDSLLVDQAINPYIMVSSKDPLPEGGKEQSRYMLADNIALFLKGNEMGLKAIKKQYGELDGSVEKAKGVSREKLYIEHEGGQIQLMTSAVEHLKKIAAIYTQKTADAISKDDLEKLVKNALHAHSEGLVRGHHFEVFPDGRVMLTDRATGTQTDRKLQDGQHQALEARFANPASPDNIPGVKVTISSNRGRTTDRMTFNTFLETMMRKTKDGKSMTAGFSGTAVQAQSAIYASLGKDKKVFEIPNNEPSLRDADVPQVASTWEEYMKAFSDDYIDLFLNRGGAPVLMKLGDGETVKRVKEWLEDRRRDLLNQLGSKGSKEDDAEVLKKIKTEYGEEKLKELRSKNVEDLNVSDKEALFLLAFNPQKLVTFVDMENETRQREILEELSGQRGAIVLTTNFAGRGKDFMLNDPENMLKNLTNSLGAGLGSVEALLQAKLGGDKAQIAAIMNQWKQMIAEYARSKNADGKDKTDADRETLVNDFIASLPTEVVGELNAIAQIFATAYQVTAAWKALEKGVVKDNGFRREIGQEEGNHKEFQDRVGEKVSKFRTDFDSILQKSTALSPELLAKLGEKREILMARLYGIQVYREVSDNLRSDLQTRGRAARQSNLGADRPFKITDNNWPEKDKKDEEHKVGKGAEQLKSGLEAYNAYSNPIDENIFNQSSLGLLGRAWNWLTGSSWKARFGALGIAGALSAGITYLGAWGTVAAITGLALPALTGVALAVTGAAAIYGAVRFSMSLKSGTFQKDLVYPTKETSTWRAILFTHTSVILTAAVPVFLGLLIAPFSIPVALTAASILGAILLLEQKSLREILWLGRLFEQPGTKLKRMAEKISKVEKDDKGKIISSAFDENGMMVTQSPENELKNLNLRRAELEKRMAVGDVEAIELLDKEIAEHSASLNEKTEKYEKYQEYTRLIKLSQEGSELSSQRNREQNTSKDTSLEGVIKNILRLQAYIVAEGNEKVEEQEMIKEQIRALERNFNKTSEERKLLEDLRNLVVKVSSPMTAQALIKAYLDRVFETYRKEMEKYEKDYLELLAGEEHAAQLEKFGQSRDKDDTLDRLLEELDAKRKELEGNHPIFALHDKVNGLILDEKAPKILNFDMKPQYPNKTNSQQPVQAAQNDFNRLKNYAEKLGKTLANNPDLTGLANQGLKQELFGQAKAEFLERMEKARNEFYGRSFDELRGKAALKLGVWLKWPGKIAVFTAKFSSELKLWQVWKLPENSKKAGSEAVKAAKETDHFTVTTRLMTGALKFIFGSFYGSLLLNEMDLNANLGKWMVRSRVEESRVDGQERRLAEYVKKANLPELTSGAVETILKPLIPKDKGKDAPAEQAKSAEKSDSWWETLASLPATFASWMQDPEQYVTTYVDDDAGRHQLDRKAEDAPAAQTPQDIIKTREVYVPKPEQPPIQAITIGEIVGNEVPEVETGYAKLPERKEGTPSEAEARNSRTVQIQAKLAADGSIETIKAKVNCRSANDCDEGEVDLTNLTPNARERVLQTPALLSKLVQGKLGWDQIGDNFYVAVKDTESGKFKVLNMGSEVSSAHIREWEQLRTYAGEIKITKDNVIKAGRSDYVNSKDEWRPGQIGQGSIIYEGSKIGKNVEVGEKVILKDTVVEEGKIGAGAVLNRVVAKEGRLEVGDGAKLERVQIPAEGLKIGNKAQVYDLIGISSGKIKDILADTVMHGVLTKDGEVTLQAGKREAYYLFHTGFFEKIADFFNPPDQGLGTARTIFELTLQLAQDSALGENKKVNEEQLAELLNIRNKGLQKYTGKALNALQLVAAAGGIGLLLLGVLGMLPFSWILALPLSGIALKAIIGGIGRWSWVRNGYDTLAGAFD
ncbi:MAG TPA: hypothetical protein VJC08_01205, partial [bacterium]|nr:hypothetical protein [bacterium]